MALFLSACQPKAVLEKPPELPPDQALFAAGEKDFAAGNYAAAMDAYKRYLEKFPEGPRAKTALYRTSQIFTRQYDYEKALAALETLAAEYPGDPQLPVVAYDMAHLYYRLGDYERSRLKALEWIGEYPDHPLMGDVLILLGQNLLALQDRPKAFYWWRMAFDILEDSPEEQQRVEERMIGLMESAELEELVEMAGYAEDSLFAPPIYFNIASLYLAEHNYQEAKSAAMALVRSTPDQFWVDIGRRILEKVSRELSVKTNAIGCLLPLSGPFAIYGQEVLNGIQLGMGLFGEFEESPAFELIIEDTAADARQTVAQLEKLATENRVVAVVGPLASKPAAAASEKAEELGVPVITLTQREGITAEGDMVFRNFLTPSKQMKTLLHRVMVEMGLNRFGILYPDNRYGEYFMNLFWDELESRGGYVTAVESYDPEETDFAAQIKKMVGLYYPRPEPLDQILEVLNYPPEELEGGEIEPESEEEPEPIPDFDAVFIPDNYQRVALIAPQFPFYSVFNVTFLGTSLWQSPELLDLAGEYLQGAVFPSGFFDGAEREAVESFVRRYRENFESEPGILAATGYDTITLLKHILSQNAIASRRDLYRALMNDNGFYGVTGKLSFDQQREVEKEPLLLTVRGSRLLPLR
jgi:ABC-type branched-subunit amino acid transport system substrate-binding protein/outer membrane protein assembly factor BamD (BamD/ComL family)